MFFLLPLIAAVGILALVGRHAVAIPSVPAPALAGAPSPFVVLDGFVRAGKTPPPFVIQCAIAEAELAGRMDIVTELVRMFVEPTVRAAQYAPTLAPPVFTPPVFAPSEIPRAEHASVPRMPEAGEESDEDMLRAAFGDAPIAAPSMGGPPPPRAESPAVTISGALPQMSPQAGEGYFAPAISPIPNLLPEQFGEFAERLAREAVSFEGPRHVGQFRARKDRLVELGIDPSALRGNHDAQIDALCVDMADAFEHAKESGMLRQHGRRAIDLGAKHGGTHAISTSGILAVIQAAGLEGAADWLESPADRVRFPHTTAMFVRANGVF